MRMPAQICRKLIKSALCGSAFSIWLFCKQVGPYWVRVVYLCHSENETPNELLYI
jgi:hypothetical protein